MATINPLTWFSTKSDSRRVSTAKSPRKRHRSLQIQTLEARQVLTAIVMTPYEQLLLELINRARNDPGAEATRYGIGLNDGISSTITDTPKQPVAPNQLLIDAAGAHSLDMLENDYFSHTNLAGQSPSNRAMAAGYPVGVWENISYGGSTGPIDWEANVYERHRRLFLSTTGHRQNILIDSHQEVGPGVRFGDYTSGGWTYNVGMVTEKFAAPPGDSFLTGVAFTDASDGSDADNDFYNIGEQIGTGTITATDAISGHSYSTTIGPSGGYSLQLAPGTYTVTATGGGLPADYIAENVVISSQNVKVDFETTTATLVPGQVPVTPELSIVVADAEISENGGSTTATVSRSGDTSNAILVSLSSNDTTEAVVPSTVTILAGQASTSFAITGVDDNELDETQTVTISATSTGHISSSDTIAVTNDDEPAEDPASLSFRFDFGTSSSPLQSGYARVTGWSTYNASRGHGWTSRVNNLDRGTGDSLTRDLHYRDVATFVVDLPNGNYDVTLTLGDQGPYLHDQVVSLEGSVVDNITTAPRQVVSRQYTVSVSDGQLTVLLDGRGGADPNMVVSGLQVAVSDGEPTSEPEPTPKLSLSLAKGSIDEHGGYTNATVSRTGSNTKSLVVTLSSSDSGEAAVPTNLTISAGETSASFTIYAVDDNIVDGTQTVTIGAESAGFDGDTETLTVLDDDVPQVEPAPEPTAQRFDFGTASSPVEEGYTRVTGSTTYNATRGFGWTSSVNQIDRGTGSSIKRDLHYRALGTFVVDVPNGTYQVILTVGDEGPYAHDQFVWLEGTFVESITTAGRQTVTRGYTTTVDDGQLTLRLDGRGGVDPNMVISGLEIVPASTDPPAAELSVTIADVSISENGGATTGTVSRTGDDAESLLVTLSSSDTGEATVPATVTIPAGQNSTTFTISSVDDDVLDGPQTVTILAMANGRSDGSDTLTVTNDDVPAELTFAHKFDFGTSTSPLKDGYTRVTGSTTYNANRGHGWTTTVNDLDRRAGNNVTRDLHYRDVGTFVIDVTAGLYLVRLHTGDEGNYAHDQTVSLEGTQVDSIVTARRQTVARTYAATVTDGQLTLRLDGRGGIDPNMVISGLQVIEVPEELATPSNLAPENLDEFFAILDDNGEWL